MTMNLYPMNVSLHFDALTPKFVLTLLLASVILAATFSRSSVPALSAPVPVQESTRLINLQAHVGGKLPPADCALYLAGVGLGLLAGAATIAISAGAATPVVIGMALTGSLLPSASVAC